MSWLLLYNLTISVDLILLADAKTAKKGATFMTNLHFFMKNGNKLLLSSSPPGKDQDSNNLRVNIIGNYMKEQCLINKLSKLDVTRKLGFNNISKTVINISGIEDN